MWAWALLSLSPQPPQPVSEPDHGLEETRPYFTSHMPWRSDTKLVTDSGSKWVDETVGQTSQMPDIQSRRSEVTSLDESVVLIVLGHLRRVTEEEKGDSLSFSIQRQ